MERGSRLIVGLFAVACCQSLPSDTSAQIVGGISGEIELMQEPFFENMPEWSEELDKWISVPTENQYVNYSVGMDDLNVTFDGGGYYSTGGTSQIDYTYSSSTPGAASIHMHAFSESFNDEYGSGGHAILTAMITVTAPVHYRFEANAEQISYLYEVSFNELEAYAYHFRSVWEGSFPLIYEYDNPFPTDFGSHINEGVLPAGTYALGIKATAIKYRSYGTWSEGDASLTLELLGDVNQDGYVGMLDLGAVLDDWNATAGPGGSLGDLTGDGFVGIDDLNWVLSGWGNDVRPATEPATVPIPEPVGVLLLLSGSLFLDRRKRV